MGLLQIVDEDGNFQSCEDEKNVHPWRLHASSHVIIIGASGILCRQVPPGKVPYGGLWTLPIVEHVFAGDPRDRLLRQWLKCYGLKPYLNPDGFARIHDDYENEVSFRFYRQLEQGEKIDADWCKWFEVGELSAIVKEGKATPYLASAVEWLEKKKF